MPFGLHWCLLRACSISQYDVLASAGLKKSRTVPMSSTRNNVLDGMILHLSAQYASVVSVVPATSATSVMPVFGGSGVAALLIPKEAHQMQTQFKRRHKFIAFRVASVLILNLFLLMERCNSSDRSGRHQVGSVSIWVRNIYVDECSDVDVSMNTKTIMTKCSAFGNVAKCAKTGVRICGQTKG